MKKYISPGLLFFGVVTFGAAVFVGYYVVPYKVWENVMEQSKIVDGNTRFENWEVIPVPLFQKIYFFNVTNPTEVVKGEKPILQEVGPYVYQQKRRKYNIQFNDNGTIFYREKTHVFFRPDMSNGSESDWIIFVNLPLVGTIQKAADLDMVTRYVILETINKYPEEQLYMNTTIGRLTFGGRYLPFMKELAELKGDKEILPNNTFGLYYGKNGTDQGLFEIYSGAQHPDKFGDVVSWNGQSKLEWWGDDEYCNRINGSDGGIFQPYATKQRIFQMFIPGLCKTFRFTYDSDGEVYGVPVLKYSIHKSFFQGAKDNPDNACYCLNPGENYENCHDSGVFSMAGCGKGAMMLSQPHFYQGSDIYTNQSIGLQPDKDRHEMALHIEPYTSVSARVSMRFQMNVELKPAKFFRPLKKIPRMVHPLFWIDQSVVIPEESAAILREKLHGTVNIANLVTHVGMIAGCVLIILSLLCFFLCSRKEDYDDTKTECISYQPREAFSSDETVLKAIPNGVPCMRTSAQHEKFENHSENVPFLQQNGKSRLDMEAGVSQDVPDQAKKSDINSVEDPSPSTFVHLTCEGNENSQHIQPQLVVENFDASRALDSPKIQLQSEINASNEPDSRLSPFPQANDFSSSLSIADMNTLKDTIEAMSSYENL